MTNKPNSQTKELVSAVIPTYNRAHIICDAIESVVSQSYRPVEIVIVDDGSTDETEAAIDQWKSDHADCDVPIRFVQQANQGGNVARNRGILESQGTLIAFLDSDDTWHDSKIEKQVDAILRSDSVGAVYCGLQHVELETGEVTSIPNRTFPSGRILEEMLIKDVTAPTSTYMVRKSTFDQVGNFDETLQARQDWDMWIRVAADFEIGCVPEILVDFRDHSGPRTFSDPTKEIRAYAVIIEKYKYLHKRCKWSTRRQIKASFYRRMGRVYFHKRISKAKAFWFYLCAIFYWPFTFDSYAALIGMALPKGLRAKINQSWNWFFGKTFLAIRSH